MNKAIAEKTDMLDAMFREEVGGISFYWGFPGTASEKFTDGNGISHLIARRNIEGNDGEAVARKLVDVIAHGEMGEPYTRGTDIRRDVTKDGFKAILSLYRYGNRETWLLTGWGKKVTSSAQGNLAFNSQGYTHQHDGMHIDAAEVTEANITPLGTDGKPLFQAQAQEARPWTGIYGLKAKTLKGFTGQGRI